jgi:cell shape-determining protein MreC
MVIRRASFLRTALLWGLLETFAAWQVRTADGPILLTWLRAVIHPAVATADRVGDLTVDLGHGIHDLQRVISDHRRLRLQLEEIRARELLLEEDLQALREACLLAGPTSEFNPGAQVARCAFRNLSAGTMEVRTESRLVIPHDAAVMAAGGLVGRVVRSEGRRHWIQMLTHVTAAVAVRTTDGSLNGLALGTGTEALTVAYVPRQGHLERGVVLVTSGGDGIFPPGLPAVEVIRVRETEDPFLEVRAIPTVNLKTVRVVLILPDWSPENSGVGQ